MAEHKMQVVNGIRCRPEDVEAVRDRLTAAGHAIEEPIGKRRRAPAKGRTAAAADNGVAVDDDGSSEGTGDGSAQG